MSIIELGVGHAVTPEDLFDANTVRLRVVRMLHIGQIESKPAVICDNGVNEPIIIQMGAGPGEFFYKIMLHDQPHDEMEFQKIGLRGLRPVVTFEEFSKIDGSQYDHTDWIPTSWEWRPKTLHLSRSRHS